MEISTFLKKASAGLMIAGIISGIISVGSGYLVHLGHLGFHRPCLNGLVACVALIILGYIVEEIRLAWFRHS